MMLRVALLVFPGSNCDRDVAVALETIDDVEVDVCWHTEDKSLLDYDVLILPGGFSYGDTLRAGALARHSPIMHQVQIYREQDRGYILGICNGFQVLTEAGLLPGALHRNNSQRFVCRPQELSVESVASAFTKGLVKGQSVSFPIAHHQGCYVIDDEGLLSLREHGQIAFTYKSNPNGSTANIAGVFSRDKRVLGLMPHPERNVLPGFGDGSGKVFFSCFFEALLEGDQSEL